MFRRFVLWPLAIIASLLTAYLIAAWIGSSLPRNSDWVEPDAGIEILVSTNGVHTEIIMPIVSPAKDWRATFPSVATPRDDGRMPTHIAVGWGEREIFLNTPTWADLDIPTAARIAVTGGDSLLRVIRYTRPAPDENHRPIRLRVDEYQRLVAAIEATLPPLEPGEPRKTLKGFERNAVNFAANGTYTVFTTCNQWTSDVLAKAGVKTGRWTPLAGGVLKWIDPPEMAQ